MPIFNFIGRNIEGKSITGRRLSQSADRLSIQLLKEGVTPIQISAVKEMINPFVALKHAIFGEKVPLEDLSMFTRQMHTLVRTGVPITSALRQLANNSRSVTLSNALYGMVENLEEGQDLAGAMQDYPNVFNNIMISMAKVGESTGKLDEAFLNLHQYLELESTALKKAKAAFRYPSFVFAAIIVAIFFINFLVIPTFANIFEQSHIQLPWVTSWLIAFSGFFKKYWILMLLSTIGLITAFVMYVKTPKGRYFWHSFQLKIPIVGPILKRILLLRFAQTFSLVIASGVPLLEGIKLISDSVNNEYARREVLNIREAVQRGNSLTQASAASTFFTPLELQMMAVSEESGALAEMFTQVADYYRREVEFDLKRLNDIIEPLLIVGMAVVVLGLALAVYLPIWNMVKLVH